MPASARPPRGSGATDTERPGAAPMSARQEADRRSPSRSESTEDHLERIQELVDRNGYARVSDLAEALGLSSSTVSNMVRRLA
ncbi:MAG: metal-dependent transcriptional regulator, partial [Verrucomicrobiota bacterium]